MEPRPQGGRWRRNLPLQDGRGGEGGARVQEGNCWYPYIIFAPREPACTSALHLQPSNPLCHLLQHPLALAPFWGIYIITHSWG